MIGTAIVGAGRMGRIRARAIMESRSGIVKVVSDTRPEMAAELGALCHARIAADWRDAVSQPDVDAVVVATPTMFHADIASAAAAAGKHVLCEKPLARNAEEGTRIVTAAQASGVVLKIGFNYRHLPHIRKAKEMIAAGELGRLMFMRCDFGHGGRPGFENEWHADPELSGGGVLQEQGIHLMDLIRFLLGEPVRCLGLRSKTYWKLKETEDNCFCLFETAEGQVAQIHVSWTQWINSFHMEIFGQDGYVRLSGRDGHYGPPRLTWARRNVDHSRPVEHDLQFETGEDWVREWQEFSSAIEERREPMGSGADGLRAQQLIEAVYKSSAAGCWIDAAPAGNGDTK